MPDMNGKLVARPWQPQDLIDDLQGIIDEECDAYLNTRRTTLCMARDYLKEHFAEQEWISVKDRLPEDDLPKDTKKKMIRCFVYTDKGTVKPCVRQRWEHFNGKMQPWMWNKDLYAKPTHWMYYH